MHRFSSDYIRKQNYLVLVIIIILLAIGVGVHGYFNHSLKPVRPGSQQVVKVVIPANSTDSQVSRILKERGLVRNRFVFYYYLQTHKTHGLKAGTFRLQKGQSIQEITENLQESRHAK